MVISFETLFCKALYVFAQEYRHNRSCFLREREDSHDVGIWTWCRLHTAFPVYGPDFHVSFIRSTDLGIDTLVQHERETLPYASEI